MEILAGVLSLQAQHISASALYIPAIIGYRIKLSNPPPTTLYLHARQLDIQSARIGDVECEFRVVDYLREVDRETPRDPQSLVDAWTADVIYARDFGELEITVPKALPNDPHLLLEITYRIPSHGNVVFCIDQPGIDDHLYSRTGFMHAGELGMCTLGPRTLFPTLEHARFRMRILIETKADHVAVATGRCIRCEAQEATPRGRQSLGAKLPPARSPSTLYEFEVDGAIDPSALGFVVGRFAAHVHPEYPWITSYILANRPLLLDPSKLDGGVSYLQSKLGFSSPPPSSFGGTYAQVFVAAERASQALLAYGSLSILSDAWLETQASEGWWPNPLEQHLGWHAQLVGFVAQYMGWRAKRVADTWIPVGLCAYIALHVLKEIEGERAFHSVFCTWQRRVRGEAEPRGNPLPRPLAPPRVELEPRAHLLWAMQGVDWDSAWAARAGWVMYMIEQRLTWFVLFNVLTYLASHPNESICEVAFLTLLKLRAGPDLSQDVNINFIQQWIRQTHIPRFTGRVEYQEKARRVTVSLKQDAPPPGVELYAGAMRIQVVEKKGTWAYEKQVDAREHTWVFECRTVQSKGKGGRRPRVEEEKSEQWNRAGEKTSDQLLALSSNNMTARYWAQSAVVQYLVLDPGFAWIMDVHWIQPIEYWLEWLHDPALRSNTALQLYAIEQIGRADLSPDPLTRSPASSYIGSIVSDVSRDPAVRMQAIRTLRHIHERFTPASVNDHARWVEQDMLYAIWKKLYCNITYDQVLAPATAHDELLIRPLLLETLASLHARDGGVHINSLLPVLESVAKLEAYEMDPYDKTELTGAVYQAAAIVAVGALKHERNPVTELTTFSVESDVTLGDIVRGIRMWLDVDLVMPRVRGQHPTTVRLLDALARLEDAKVLPLGATCYSFYAKHPIWRADPQVRMFAFRRIGGSSLLLQAVQDPCPRTRIRMVEWLLTQAPRGGGCGEEIWKLLNQGSASDAILRECIFRLWEKTV